MKGDWLSWRNCNSGTMTDLSVGSKEAEDGGDELESTDAACGDESLIKLANPKVWRAW